MDVTGSMGPWIEEQIKSIGEIVMQINQVYRHKKVLMGFLGYRDVNDKKQFEVFPFSEKPEEMVEFLK
jgi:hypothetical protein